MTHDTLIGQATPDKTSRQDADQPKILVAEFLEMIKSGEIAEDDPVELLEGEIVEKMTKHPPHILTMKRLNRLMHRVLPDDWHPQFQDSIKLDDSVPEPDVVVIRGSEDDYSDRLATGTDISVIIEVADSSLAKDRRKAAAYARGGIPRYWIVNLTTSCIEEYTDPMNEEGEACYRSVRVYSPEDDLPLILDGSMITKIPVNIILP